MPKSSFEDHMRIVEGSHTKTASASKVTPSLLDKLAAEMAGGGEKGAVDAPAKTAVQADATVAEAAPAVVAATEAIAVPQTNIAGGNEAEKEKGMTSPASKPAAVVIGDGDKKVTDAQNFSKEPEAVAEAAKGTGGSEKTSSDKEAEEIGRTMAKSYVTEMRKIAVDEQYSESVRILKEAGLLDNYKIDEVIEKTASVDETPGLTKIANQQPLTKEDMVKAATEYVELSKLAEEADAFGRQQARDYFAKLVKQAQEEEEEEEEEEDEKKKKEKPVEKEKKASDDTTVKVASDKAIEKAVDVLVKAGVIKN
jgi:hypothetical protein